MTPTFCNLQIKSGILTLNRSKAGLYVLGYHRLENSIKSQRTQ